MHKGAIDETSLLHILQRTNASEQYNWDFRTDCFYLAGI